MTSFLSLIGLIQAFILCNSPSSDQQIISYMDPGATTFIIIRHAERENADADCNLSTDGISRAETLKHVLTAANVNAIYTTPYKRTKQTAEPLALAKKIMISEYSTRTPYQELIQEILSKHQGKVVVIVGHSNTIPQLLKVLSNDSPVSELEDGEFDNLFIVNYTTKADSKVVRLKYGRSTP